LSVSSRRGKKGFLLASVLVWMGIAGCSMPVDMGGLNASGQPDRDAEAGATVGPGGDDGGPSEAGPAEGVQGPDADASAAPLCSRPDLLFCDDFDGRTDVRGPWTSQSTSPGITLDLAPQGAGQALHVTGPVQKDGAQSHAYLSKQIPIKPLTAKRVVVELDVTITANLSGYYGNGASRWISMSLTNAALTTTYSSAFIALGSPYVVNAQYALGVSPAGASAASAPTRGLAAKLGAMTHVIIEMVFDASAGSVGVSVDGVSDATIRNIDTIGAVTDDALISLTLGLVSHNNATAAITGIFDNVIVY
jgi:hypothetical protein